MPKKQFLGVWKTMDKKISVFGGTGFIGSNFCRLYPAKSICVSRETRIPPTDDIIYFISTTHILYFICPKILDFICKTILDLYVPKKHTLFTEQNLIFVFANIS